MHECYIHPFVHDSLKTLNVSFEFQCPLRHTLHICLLFCVLGHSLLDGSDNGPVLRWCWRVNWSLDISALSIKHENPICRFSASNINRQPQLCTAGFDKTVATVYTLLLNTIYVSHRTKVAEVTVFRKHTVGGCKKSTKSCFLISQMYTYAFYQKCYLHIKR